MDAITALTTRRSVSRLAEPAPAGADLETLLQAAVAAPDHDHLRPWRIVLLAGEAKDQFGEVLAASYRERCAACGTDVVPAREEKERAKLGRAPLVLVIGAVRTASKTVPWDDQVWSAAAVATNIGVAAHALGYASIWRTGEPVTDRSTAEALGFSEEDQIVGFIYLGTPTAEPRASVQPRAAAGDIVSWWGASS